MSLNYIVAPEKYETAEFTLRSYQPGDGAALKEAVENSYDHLKTFMPWARPDPSLEGSERSCREWRGKYLLAQDFTIAVFSPDGSRLLGGTGFHLRGIPLGDRTAEIGMWIRADSAGKGLGTEVLKAMLTWGFSEWPWEKLFWRCNALNVASMRTAEKAGMQREGYFRSDAIGADGQTRRDTIYFGALRGEWSKQ